jgi:hypothetical protein
MLLAVLFALPRTSNKIFLYFISGLGIVLFAAFRDGLAVRDYKNYISFFEQDDLLIEPSFIFLRYLLKEVLYLPVIFLFIIYAFLGVGIKIIAIKRLSPFIFFSLLVYISNFFILHDLTQIRAGVASGILLLCIKPLYERNFWLFLFLTSIAVIFHYSAIVILPLWFLDGKSFNKKIFLSIIPIGILIYFLKIDLILNIPIDIFKEKIIAYKELQEYDVDGFNEINVFNIIFIFRCFVFYIMALKIEFLQRKNQNSIVLLKIYGISIALLPAFAVMPVVAFRLNELFCIVELILLPFIIFLFKPKLVSKGAVIAIALSFLLFNIFYNEYIL